MDMVSDIKINTKIFYKYFKLHHENHSSGPPPIGNISFITGIKLYLLKQKKMTKIMVAMKDVVMMVTVMVVSIYCDSMVTMVTRAVRDYKIDNNISILY